MKSREVAGVDGDRARIGKLLGDRCALSVAEIGRLRLFGSASGLQIGQVVRRRSVGVELGDGPAGGAASRRLAACFASVPQSTEDDRRKPRNDQHDQADAPRIHLFSVPYGRLAAASVGNRAPPRRRSERRRSFLCERRRRRGIPSAMREQLGTAAPEGLEPRSSVKKWGSASMKAGWIEQIREAIERGEFDNLPGKGRPIKGLNGRDDENWWVKAYLEREQLPLPLPTSLALRKEVMALPETLADQQTRHPYARSWPI